MSGSGVPMLGSIVPLAHLGHFLWIFYLLPVLFVVLGLVKTTLSERRRKRDE